MSPALLIPKATVNVAPGTSIATKLPSTSAVKCRRSTASIVGEHRRLADACALRDRTSTWCITWLMRRRRHGIKGIHRTRWPGLVSDSQGTPAFWRNAEAHQNWSIERVIVSGLFLCDAQ